MLSLLKRLFGVAEAPERDLPLQAPIEKQEAPKLPYRVYSRQYDLEVSPDDVPPSHPRRFRDSPPTPQELQTLLDNIHSAHGFAADVKASAEAWRGVLRPDAGVLVTMLVDHSGSMRGAKSHQALAVIEAIATVLDCAVATYEVLGFTTSSWQGGMSRGKWLREGGSPIPGRLCDLLHIVYKSADGDNSNWRRGLTVLLDDDQLKENVDGEALLWAHERAKASRATRWLCIVISDGAPVDDSTIMNNEPGILSNHLGEVVAALTERREVQLCAIIFGPIDWQTPFSNPLLLLPEQKVGEISGAAIAFLGQMLGALSSRAAHDN